MDTSRAPARGEVRCQMMERERWGPIDLPLHTYVDTMKQTVRGTMHEPLCGGLLPRPSVFWFQVPARGGLGRAARASRVCYGLCMAYLDEIHTHLGGGFWSAAGLHVYVETGSDLLFHWVWFLLALLLEFAIVVDMRLGTGYVCMYVCMPTHNPDVFHLTVDMLCSAWLRARATAGPPPPASAPSQRPVGGMGGRGLPSRVPITLARDEGCLWQNSRLPCGNLLVPSGAPRLLACCDIPRGDAASHQ